jgi:hypothetical protein
MNIDLGYLGKVVLEEIPPHPVKMGFSDALFTIVLDGYTESGIRVHGVVDEREFTIYPSVWNNAIMIKVN